MGYKVGDYIKIVKVSDAGNRYAIGDIGVIKDIRMITVVADMIDGSSNVNLMFNEFQATEVHNCTSRDKLTAELKEEVEAICSKCTCDIHDLMNFGCKCGCIDKEKK